MHHSKVTILNHGPDPLKLEVLHRDEDGRFLPGVDILVEPGSFGEVFVHSSNSVHIYSVEKGATSSDG